MRRVSVASLNFNQKDLLVKLYDSLVQNKDYLEVWSLWDDGSTDGSVEIIKGWQKDGVIPMQVNFSTGKSLMGVRMNWAVQHTYDLFIQIFGDSYLEPDGLKKLSETYVDGTAGSGYRFDITLDGSLVRNDFRFEPNDNVYSVMHHVKPWQSLCGNGFICRKKDLEAIGWFDEAYTGYGYDDYDWFMRLMMNGVKLYAYNNIKVYHHDHPTATANPANLERYTKKMTGDGYQSSAKEIVFSLDDFSVEVNNLYYLDLLKKTYPKFKISMFYVPFDVTNFSHVLDFQRKEIIQQIKDRREWIELIPHGLTHVQEEFLNIKNDDYETIFKGIEEAFRTYGLPMVTGFKPPQWLYKPNLVEFLDRKGYWLGVDRNQPNAPRTKKYYEYTHSIDEPFWLSKQETIRLHGHIAGPSKNDLVGNISNLMKVNPDATWKFVSEVME